MESDDSYITSLIDLFIEYHKSIDVCKYLCKKIQNKRLQRKYKRIIAACVNKCLINNMHEIFKKEVNNYILWLPYTHENNIIVDTNYENFISFVKIYSCHTRYLHINKYFLYKYLDSIIHDYYYAELEETTIIDTFCKKMLEYISNPLFIPGSRKNLQNETYIEIRKICNNYHKYPSFLNFLYEAFSLPIVFFSKESIIYNDIKIDDEDYEPSNINGFYGCFTEDYKFYYQSSFIIYFLRVLLFTLDNFFIANTDEENEILAMTNEERAQIKSQEILKIKNEISKNNFVYNKKLINTPQKIKIAEYHKKYVLMIQSVWETP